MSTVIYRLNRGPFTGTVERHDDGPWRGWYSYTWNAGPVGGGQARLGKTAAFDGLYRALLDYFVSTNQARELVETYSAKRPRRRWIVLDSTT